MIVTCEECSTSFQLDESRIPASGAQVRCSRCKHAFFLSNPSASQSDATHAIAEEAAQDSMSGVPPVASDVEADEEDWQFSKEVRVEGEDAVDSADGFGEGADFADDLDAEALLADVSPEELESDVATSEGGGIDADAASGPAESSGLELESEPESTEVTRDESAFGSVDDFSSLMEDDDVAPVDLGGDGGAELAGEAVESASAGVYASGGTTDDLGDPESWDLVGGDSPSTSRTAIGSFGAALGRELPGADITFGDDSDEAFYEDEDRQSSPIWQWLGRVGSVAGWAGTLALIAGVLALGLRSEWSQWIQSPQSTSLGALSAETSQIRWVETSRAGFVMVVEGRLRNTGGDPLWPRRVQLSILDAAGERLAAPPIPAGEPLSERVLRESPTDVLVASAARAAMRLRAAPLAPGEVRSFVAIALEDDVPEDARRVLLEISDAAAAAPARRPPAVERTGLEDRTNPNEAGPAEAGPVDPEAGEIVPVEAVTADPVASIPAQLEEESGFSP